MKESLEILSRGSQDPKTVAGVAATATLLDPTTHVTDAAEGIERSTSQKALNPNKDDDKNNTPLKQAVSLIGAVVSVPTKLVFGAGIPVYAGTMGSKLLDKLPAGNHPLHQITRNIANIAIGAANIGLYAGSRTALPYLETKITQNIKEGYNNSKSNGLLNKVGQWYNENKEKTALGKTAKVAVNIAKGVDYLHESWGNLVKSKAVYHTLTFAVGATALAATGPIGWAAAAAVATVDITRGALKVNRIQAKKDEFDHYRSYDKSAQEVSNLGKSVSEDLFKQLEKECCPSITEKQAQQVKKDSNESSKGDKLDEFDKSLLKGTIATTLKEGIAVGSAAASAAINPIGFGTAAALAAVSLAANTASKLSEQDAKDGVNKEINKLHTKYSELTTIENSTKKSWFQENFQPRNYEIAKFAEEKAILAKALEVAIKNPGFDAQKCKAEAISSLKMKAEHQKLFSEDKTKKPTGLGYIYSAAKSSLFCVADYLHPFKEATSYAQVHEEVIETLHVHNASHVQNTKTSLQPHTHEKEAENLRSRLSSNDTHPVSNSLNVRYNPLQRNSSISRSR